MLTKSPAALLRPRDRPVGARSREARQDLVVRSVVVPRAHIGGDTDALGWHSDPHLLAILARGVKRERGSREGSSLGAVTVGMETARWHVIVSAPPGGSV
jgi:hypothetical protein